MKSVYTAPALQKTVSLRAAENVCDNFGSVPIDDLEQAPNED